MPAPSPARIPWQVVWFKRDLRIRDHAPLVQAAASGPVLGVYLYEPELLSSPEWDPSHSRFIADALRELAREFEGRGGRLLLRRGEAVEELERLHREIGFTALWSHEETGNRITFDRDLRVGRWCRDRGVRWEEIRQDGVIRRLRSRDGWAERWNRTMGARAAEAPSSLGNGPAPGLASEGILGPEELGSVPSRTPNSNRAAKPPPAKPSTPSSRRGAPDTAPRCRARSRRGPHARA